MKEQGTAKTEYADRASIVAWLATWGEFVAQRDFHKARDLFDPDVVGFGTYSDFVRGLRDLEQQQWRTVWPTIDDFRFDLDDPWVEVSADRLLGHLAARWYSTGFHKDGRPFERPGRCTVTLRRASVAAPWLGTHTHFSLARGVPQSSHGGRAAAE